MYGFDRIICSTDRLTTDSRGPALSKIILLFVLFQLSNLAAFAQDEDRLRDLSDAESLTLDAWSTAMSVASSDADHRVRRPSEESLKSFVDTVETQLAVVAPSWWVDHLNKVQITETDELHFRANESTYIGSKLNSDQDITAEAEPNRPVIIRGEEFRFSPAFLEEALDSYVRGRVEAIHAEKETVVAFFSDTPYDFALYCVGNDGTIKWTGNVVAKYRRGTAISGVSWHAVQIVETEKFIVVFGQSGGTFYVEGFEREYGGRIFMFHTDEAELRKIEAAKLPK